MSKINHNLKVRLYLDSKDVRDGNYIMFSVSWRHNRYKFSSGIHITKTEQDYFLFHNQIVKLNFELFAKPNKADRLSGIGTNFDEYNKEIKNIYDNLQEFFKQEKLLSVEDLKAFIRNYKAIPVTSSSDKFIDQYKLYLEGVNNKKSTMERKSNIVTIIEDYNTRIDIDYFNSKKNVSQFLNHLFAKKYLNSTIKIIIIPYLKRFLNHLLKNNKMQSSAFEDHFKDLTKDLKSGSNTVALDDKEIEAVQNLELSNHKLIYARQLMLIQYYTFLRVSDLMNLKPEQIDLDKNLIKLWQTKTDNYLYIPIHPRVKPIFEELQGLILKIDTKNYNNSLKELCKLAGINRRIEVVDWSGYEKIVEVKEKWQLVSSHTLRRTGITSAIRKGLLPEQVMHISGHKRRETMEKYVKFEKEESFEAFLNKF